MSSNPYESPETPGQPVKPTGRGFRLIELLAIVGIIGLLIACVLPAFRFPRGAREAGRRMSCANNLKQIALALRSYHDEFGSFPPAYTVDAAGKPLHSWRTLILPFLEQKSLYEEIDLSKPWDDPANLEAYETQIRSYQCASLAIPKNHTNYLAILAPGGCFPPMESRTLADITDGPDHTLLVIEVPAESATPWMSPTDASEDSIRSALMSGKSPHPSGLQAALADGRVLVLSNEIKPETLRALVSIAGTDNAEAAAAD